MPIEWEGFSKDLKYLNMKLREKALIQNYSYTHEQKPGRNGHLAERKNEQMAKSDWNMKNLILERRDEKGREYEGMASPGRTPRLNEGQKDRTKERSRENPNATWRTPNNFRQLEKRKLVLYTF